VRVAASRLQGRFGDMARVALGFIAFGGAVADAAQSVSPPSPDFTIRGFDSSVWPRSDAELGISGFAIEDFEDRALVPGLKIQVAGSGPSATLPITFSPATDDPNDAKFFVPGIWDGSRVLINRTTRPPSGYADFGWGEVAFLVPGGTSSFGFSLMNMDLRTELFVNDLSQGDVGGFIPTGGGRNGYIRINAPPGKKIYAVRLKNSTISNTGDALVFDHVAFGRSQSPPESISPTALGFVRKLGDKVQPAKDLTQGEAFQVRAVYDIKQNPGPKQTVTLEWKKNEELQSQPVDLHCSEETVNGKKQVSCLSDPLVAIAP
jgi:hypothetical protein